MSVAARDVITVAAVSAVLLPAAFWLSYTVTGALFGGQPAQPAPVPVLVVDGCPVEGSPGAAAARRVNPVGAAGVGGARHGRPRPHPSPGDTGRAFTRPVDAERHAEPQPHPATHANGPRAAHGQHSTAHGHTKRDAATANRRDQHMTAPVPAASGDPDCPAPGTHAGVSRHRRLKQPACDQCRVFWRDYMRRRRAPRKAPA